MTQPDLMSAAQVRKVIEGWALFRDVGAWDAFASVWHDDGWMTATWFQGPFSEFIRVSKEGFERGVQIAHFLGATPAPSRATGRSRRPR